MSKISRVAEIVWQCLKMPAVRAKERHGVLKCVKECVRKSQSVQGSAREASKNGKMCKRSAKDCQRAQENVRECQGEPGNASEDPREPKVPGASRMNLL